MSNRKSAVFSLLWEMNGRIFAETYVFQDQRRTRQGWIMTCIAAGKRYGYTYLGMAKRREGYVQSNAE